MFHKNGECSRKMTSSPDLEELTQYHFPSVTIDRLRDDPYRTYTEMYCSLSREQKFFRGFTSPDIITRAKIYRGMILLCKSSGSNEPGSRTSPLRSDSTKGLAMKDFTVFSSPNGLVIKCKKTFEPSLSEFDQHLSDADYNVFIPEKCDQLDQYKFIFYHRLLRDFWYSQHIPGEVFYIDEHSYQFMFICFHLDCPTEYQVNGSRGNGYLEQLWKQYLNGSITKTVTLTSETLESGFRSFEWNHRYSIDIVNSNIEMTVISPNLKYFNTTLSKIQPTEAWYPYALRYPIRDEHEAFGILKTLHTLDLIPIVGTSLLYSRNILSPDPNEVLNSASLPEISEGMEPFSQESFETMTRYQKLSLIQAPTGKWYFYLNFFQHCLQNPRDPLNRADFSEDFINSLKEIRKNLDGPFLAGYPLLSLEPGLIRTEADGWIYFSAKYPNREPILFWKIPDLRETEYAQLIMNVTLVLTYKWTDKTIFNRNIHFRSIHCTDIMLTFSPIAMYVFVKSNHESLLTNAEKADKLHDQIYLLQKVK